MCDPVSIGLSIAGAAFSALTAPKAPKAPKAPPVIQAPEAQAAKAPTYDAKRRDNEAMANGSGFSTNASTLLTGPSGVDPNALNLGKSVLLGA